MDSQCSEPDSLSIAEWINTEDYKEKNFNRKALVVNPAKACQPLGALFAACGYEGTLPFVHGSQGCAAYFRNSLSRHYREPFSAVSTSMTEDAAVFGGIANFVDGMSNAYALYKPKMIAVCTSCMPEVIGDDLKSYKQSAKNKKVIPADLPVALANTPSFSGSHITGYDSMTKAILSELTEGRKKSGKSEKINVIPGFDTCLGNYREIKKYFSLFNADLNLLGDVELNLDSPLDGEFRLYPGGTPLADASNAINSKATIALQKYSTIKTISFIKQTFGHETVVLQAPIGIKATDRFVMEISRLTGKEIPAGLEVERGRAVDAMTDAHQYLHGKRFALFGDPDVLIGLVSFLLEMGAEPVHIICTNGNKKFSKELNAILEASPFGINATVHAGRDLWHLRSLLMTEPVDMLIGSSHGKYAARDAGIPLVRVGYPIVDRVNSHRYPIIGYQGIINLISQIANTFLDELDRSSDDAHFELLR